VTGWSYRTSPERVISMVEWIDRGYVPE
jgi:hypothetical protein